MEETGRLIVSVKPDAQFQMQLLDISDQTSVDSFYAAAVRQFGRIDYAASVAGLAHNAQPLHEITEATFDRQYAVNQKGV